MDDKLRIIKKLAIDVIEGKIPLYKAKRICGNNTIKFMEVYNKYNNFIEPLKELGGNSLEIKTLLETGLSIIRKTNKELGTKFDTTLFTEIFNIYSKYLELHQKATQELKRQIIAQSLIGSIKDKELQRKIIMVRYLKEAAIALEQEHVEFRRSSSTKFTKDMIIKNIHSEGENNNG